MIKNKGIVNFYEKLNQYLKPYACFKTDKSIICNIDNEISYYFYYFKKPYTYGIKTKDERQNIKKYNNLLLAQKSAAFYFKNAFFQQNRLERMDYDASFSSITDVVSKIKEKGISNLASINNPAINKINLLNEKVYFVTNENKRILLSDDKTYFLQDFYRATVRLYYQEKDKKEFEKIFSVGISAKNFASIFNYV